MLILLLTALLASPAVSDINSGCPSWGCVPQGTFSFSAGIPTATAQLKWSTEIDESSGTEDSLSAQGCVSDQQTVVCATSRGYVSLDPENGQILWNYTTKSAPYLPVMDIFGDVIGMDKDRLYYVGADGKAEHPINIEILGPAFSVMVANDSILFLTSTSTQTGTVVTYGTDGIVDAAIKLTGVVERVNGTFIPCSQPIIVGFRVYLLTQFVPTDLSTKEAQESLGMQRLYALDLRARMVERIQIMWFFNLEMEKGRPHSQRTRHASNSSVESDIIPPIVMYSHGIIYINNVGPQADKRSHLKSNQPLPSMLWAFRDVGNDTQLLYKKTCWYGPMATYDTYNEPIQSRRPNLRDAPVSTSSAREGRKGQQAQNDVVWVLNRSPAMIACHNAQDGSVVGEVDVVGVSNIEGWITSKMGVTRLSQNAATDILVLGLQDSNGEAFLVALKVDRTSPGNASLVFSTKIGGAGLQGSSFQGKEYSSLSPKERYILSKARKSQRAKPSDSVRYSVAGQIVNVATQNPRRKADLGTTGFTANNWKLGVVALVEESGPSYTKLHTAAVF